MLPSPSRGSFARRVTAELLAAGDQAVRRSGLEQRLEVDIVARRMLEVCGDERDNIALGGDHPFLALKIPAGRGNIRGVGVLHRRGPRRVRSVGEVARIPGRVHGPMRTSIGVGSGKITRDRGGRNRFRGGRCQ